ncbi:hypothetical protein [Listeria ilorinensis]|uniref:hypothetical protein n=1 Tax=Listeria ilorinensis TaxID=2867439 RepID=UPI001EF739A2|nr:hypothetical protein [Listeria ilorinensis]
MILLYIKKFPLSNFFSLKKMMRYSSSVLNGKETEIKPLLVSFISISPVLYEHEFIRKIEGIMCQMIKEGWHPVTFVSLHFCIITERFILTHK